MSTKHLAPGFLLCMICCLSPASAADTVRGSWAFHLPDGYPAWLQVRDDGSADLLWSIGRARPVEVVGVDAYGITFKRDIFWKPYGREDDRCFLDGVMVGRLTDDDRLELTVPYTLHDRPYRLVLFGKRMPPLPPAPDLSMVELGEPIDLLAGGMDGWKLTDPEKRNGWRIEDGVLINESPKTDHGPYSNYGNLRTVESFEDFELNIEYLLPDGGNSGIYLRGAYEVQVLARPDAEPSRQGPGSVYGRIAPSSNPSKPAGSWNHYRILLVDRHITVDYNGVRVIDNQPLAGPTGGGVNADCTAPGPLFLQGDHTTVHYRNIHLSPVLH